MARTLQVLGAGHTGKTLKSEDLDQFTGSENMRGWQ